DSYGFIFSSHGTGWLPKGYYSTHGSPTLAGILCNGANTFSDMPGPPVKSLGNEFAGSDANQIELDLPEFVNSVPMHADYMILDMCLMGGVEVAYEFKDLTDMLIISPTEILAGGMSYENMVRNLLAGNKPDLRAVCTDYYRKYADGNSYATVSLIDCTNLDTLASVCRDLFATYRQQIADVNPASVQRFFRKDVSGRYKHWFYDLQDILSKSGISPADSARLDAALRAAVPCKAATDKFLPEKDGFRIDNFCGLSMYLPKMGDNFLDSFYDTLGWNVETGLVNLEK
ncbi:MAG: clostripain-related cysteine peptidase, partial [Bacteroidales bacterium]|nr:clostripain-related cysteine peptidase [Bacteroidales bacterium]